MLNIDDHTCYQLIADSSSRNATFDPDWNLPLDLDTMARCDAAYESVGLTRHTGKDLRGVTRGVVVGAEIEGRSGWISAPVIRIAALTRLTFQQILLRISTPRLLASIVNSWAWCVPVSPGFAVNLQPCV